MANVSYFEEALYLFERYLGYKLLETEYTERYRYGWHGALLKNDYVKRIVSVKGRTDSWGDWMSNDAFHESVWIDINPEHCDLHTRGKVSAVTVPSTIFGTRYTEVEVTYVAGLKKMPEDVKEAVNEIASLLRSGDITDWNCIFPNSVHDVLDKYRKEVR